MRHITLKILLQMEMADHLHQRWCTRKNSPPGDESIVKVARHGAGKP